MLEATFIGLWVFGWDRLSPKVHLATIYLVWLGTWLSAYFILAANSWMQHPVGYEINSQTDRAEANDIFNILFQGFVLFAWTHAILAGLLTGGFLVLGVSCWHLRRGRNVELFRGAAKLAIIVVLPVSFVQLGVGSEFGVAVTDAQPMKIAATEALWETEEPAAFSLFQIGGFTEDDQTPSFDIEIPGLLSFLATNSFKGQVVGINELQSQSEQQYGSGNYIPDIRLSLLEHARDGLPGDAVVPARALGRLAAAGARSSTEPSGSSAPRSSGSRSPSSPTSPAGSSPRPGASRGSPTGS